MRRTTTLLSLVALAAACGPSISVRSDFNPQYQDQLAGWRTYSWLPAPRGADPRIYNDITRGRIEASVDRQLAARGMRKVDSNPDFRIGWHASIDGRMNMQTINNAYGYDWRWYGPTYSSTYVDQYDEGTLILDFVSAQANQLAWRGVAQGRLRDRPTAEEAQAQIDAAVQEILSQFPPR